MTHYYNLGTTRVYNVHFLTMFTNREQFKNVNIVAVLLLTLAFCTHLYSFAPICNKFDLLYVTRYNKTNFNN